MGKKQNESQKTGLGRALVRQHNHMIQQSKEKSRFYRKKVLESYTEVSDIDAIIEQSNEPLPAASTTLISLDSASVPIEATPEETRKQQKREEALHAASLRVPRRPPWTPHMSADELHESETQAFLVWRRNLARLEENKKLVLTPFEKNLDIWRQLWRVVERSDLLVMVVDSRDPLFYRCPDLEAYAREVDEHKRTLLLVNKADLLPASIREKWAEYFRANDILFIFWSAKAATAALEGRKLGSSNIKSAVENTAGSSSSNHVIVGFVGYPNVGKSSTINALVGQKRTGVTSTPGKTKHFQTLIISDKLTLCDCPGLVFPSFSSSRYEMIACGVLPIDRMTEHRESVQVVADRVPRHVIEEIYKIRLPKPKPYESQSRPPLASELLRAYCASRGYVASSGLPDETRASRQILKDYIDGKLPHYEMPPGASDEEQDLVDPTGHDSVDLDASDSSDIEDSSDVESELAPNLEHVLDDLNSFDMANGLAPKNIAVKKSKASHKHHKKPQRKKDRSWRAGKEDADGMPVARFFQKPANTGPLKVG
uniref:Large subunit GTPase 1 n=1 Tax=Cajanus cajan TaxID=3821 RepID=A0A151R8V6_CAJCA|nr:Large subunit GTPase 1 [Cajanus cajan]